MAPTKALKLKRALKSAARFPVRVSGGRGSGRNTYNPLPGELPVVVVRLQVLGCKDLLAKDRNGTSDPFVVVSMLNTRHQTPVSKRNINPTYPAKEATFDFPIFLSLADKLGIVELVVWDKDVLRKDYLGEVALPLDNWFRGGNAYAFDDPNNEPFSASIVSSRASKHATGTVQIKLGFVAATNSHSLLGFDELYSELVKSSRPSLVSAPPTEGFGTIRSHQAGPAYEDDGGISSDEGEPNSEDEDDELQGQLAELYIPPPKVTPPAASTPTPPASSPVLDETPQPHQLKPLPPRLNLPMSPSTPTPSSNIKTAKPSTPGFIPKLLTRKSGAPSAYFDSAHSPLPTPGISSPSVTTPTTSGSQQLSVSGPSTQPKRNKFRRSWSSKKADYNFSAANDILGIVMLEIQGATDLPRLKNITRTGWDMDPFVVISFGKKVFRTRVIRHCRDPVWDEKLLFHVRRYETAFKVQLTVLDWDKLSSNDYVGDASFDISELIADAPQPDPVTGLYAEEEGGDHPMKDFSLQLTTVREMPWEFKHRPVLTFRAKYQPYDALRQRFWRQYLKQYDAEDNGTLSHLELTSMLDSLGSTLSRSTINSFFTRHNKRPAEDELTVSEAIQCLETELGRPDSERKRINEDDAINDFSLSVSMALTPTMQGTEELHGLALEKLDFAGPPFTPTDETNGLKPGTTNGYVTEPSELPLSEAARADKSPYPDVSPRTGNAIFRGPAVRSASSSSSDYEDSTGSNSSEDSFERVINIKNCPLCHRPRLNSKAEVDIITHLAVCASQDWAKVNRIVVGNFVTASQAQRKWYTKVISKVSSGNYRLGANSANIIVQNRMTGQLEEEKMQVYVRLGIRLLYKGAKSRMEGARARKLLKSLSIKQGVKYDSPESARDIPTFILFHKINVSEIQDPIDSFKTFNQFFYRKLKPTARPVELPDDPFRIVSAADCRLMAFETVHEATRLWIKGREFTVARLLGDAYKGEAEKYAGGALAIFRLAPQDYHRFHSPVAGKIGSMNFISGEYYTVNPQAIRTALDVYGENVRTIVPIMSPQFGQVMAVCIGAMMVGSIKNTVKEGDSVQRGEELGYFAFGGSTVVVLFEKGTVEWDEDLVVNGKASLETLVRVGMGIGRGRHGYSTPR